MTNILLEAPALVNKNRELNKTELRLYRGVVGQLNWASNVSRPDMAFSACELSTRQAKAKIVDVITANKAVREIKSDKLSIIYKPLKVGELKLIVFSDASYGNLRWRLSVRLCHISLR